MAANNLYPPIIDTYMPTYLNPKEGNHATKCRIYFALSSLNSYEEIKYVQLSLVNQKNNKSALNPILYPNGIKMTKLSSVSTDQGLYYIDLYVGKNKSGSICDMEKFEINQYYKAQIRFVSHEAEELDKNATLINVSANSTYTIYNFSSIWLGNNLSYFSEWSTVCLLKGIFEPNFIFSNSNLNSLIPGETSKVIDISENIPVIGTFNFGSNETDYLKSYRISLLNSDSSIIYEDSGWLFTDSFNPNSVNYLTKYITEANVVYTLKIEYTTNNLYENILIYKFERSAKELLTLEARIQAYINRDEDQIVIRADINPGQKDFSGYLIIKRASSDDNFKQWENVHKVAMKDLKLISGYLWGDFTIQSGKWYKYALQWIQDTNSSKIQYSQNIILEEPISLILEEICIVGNNTQVKIKYDPKISSFNYKTVQSITETIGSQYPFIRRNGNINYKTFNISGLITRHMDENEFFADAATVYGNSDMIEYYEQYNQENRINPYNDHTYEYLFREKVLDFFNDGNIKLFRSPSEGNLLISLSNISITPNETLGRLVYNFSATATEVGKATIENYIKYNIVDFQDDSYVLQGIKIMEENGYIIVYASSTDIKEGNYIMNAGIQSIPGKNILLVEMEV